MHQYVWIDIGWASLERATTVGGGELADRPVHGSRRSTTMLGIDGYRVRAHRDSRNTTGPTDTTAATGGLERESAFRV